MREVHFTVSSFRRFASIIDANLFDYRYLWRGHGCSKYKLQSSLYRLFHDGDFLGQKSLKATEAKVNELMEDNAPYAFSMLFDRLSTVSEHSSSLRDLLSKSLSDLSIREENEIWALGQHYGLKTPLLDWSLSPYVALFFACADCRDNHFRFNRAGLVKSSMHVYGLPFSAASNSLSELEEPSTLMQVIPKYSQNARLLAQQGVFTRLYPDGDLLARLRKIPKAGDSPPLIRITIPNSMVHHMLVHLYRTNIAYHTLYPDLEGQCRFSNHDAVGRGMYTRFDIKDGYGFKKPSGQRTLIKPDEMS